MHWQSRSAIGRQIKFRKGYSDKWHQLHHLVSANRIAIVRQSKDKYHLYILLICLHDNGFLRLNGGSNFDQQPLAGLQQGNRSLELACRQQACRQLDQAGKTAWTERRCRQLEQAGKTA